ncbi:hypothetical protein D3C71_1883620 [compost metagenome]
MGFAQPFSEQGAIRQASQFIVVGQIAHALFGFATGRQIGEEADNMADIPPRIAHCIQLQPLWIELTVFTGLHQLTLPGSVLFQRVMNCTVVSACIATAR